MNDEMLNKIENLLNKIYEKIGDNQPLTQYEQGVYETLGWIFEDECDDDVAPEIS